MKKTYTTGEMIDVLEIGQIAVQVNGEFHETEKCVSFKNGNSVYYDPNDKLLKSSTTNNPILIFKPRENLSKWIIVDTTT